MKEFDMKLGTEKLTRGLTQKAAQRKLKKWRKDRLEDLLRDDKDSPAYVLRVWHENPEWDGGGTWHWAQKHWYTTIEEAKAALKEMAGEKSFEIKEMKVSDIPGNFSVA